MRISYRTSRAFYHDQAARPEDFGIAVPLADLQERITADDEEQPIFGMLGAKVSNGIDGIGLAPPVAFDVREFKRPDCRQWPAGPSRGAG